MIKIHRDCDLVSLTTGPTNEFLGFITNHNELCIMCNPFHSCYMDADMEDDRIKAKVTRVIHQLQATNKHLLSAAQRSI